MLLVPDALLYALLLWSLRVIGWLRATWRLLRAAHGDRGRRRPRHGRPRLS